MTGELVDLGAVRNERDAVEMLDALARTADDLATKARDPHARAVKKRLAERAKELAGEGER